MTELLERLGRPHESVPALHVAATRGKGSTCALLSAALHAAGLRVGLTTSPHLVAPTERIRIDERDVTAEHLLDLAGRIREEGEDLQPSYFEVMAAAAFLAFAEARCDVSVLEVGLGGRLDASNVCRPAVTAIARLGMDHQDRLGTTPEAIAREKAGIFKPGVPAVVSADNDAGALEAVREVALRVGAPLRWVGPDVEAPPTGLVGPAQAQNARLAAAVLRELRGTALEVPEEAIARGFAAVRWRGRLERLEHDGVEVLADVAHDEAAIGTVLDHLRGLERDASSVLFSCLSDKPLDRLAALLASEPRAAAATFVVPRIEGPRARDAAEVEAALVAAGLTTERTDSVASGLARCVALARGATRPLVVATGSFHVAGAVIGIIDGG